MNSTSTTNWRPIAGWRRAGTALTIAVTAGLAVGACGSGDSGGSKSPAGLERRRERGGGAGGEGSAGAGRGRPGFRQA